MSISIAQFPPNLNLFYQGLPIPGSLFERWVQSAKDDCRFEAHPPSVDIQHCDTGALEVKRLMYDGHSAEQLGMLIQSFVGRRGINLTPEQVAASLRFQTSSQKLINTPNVRVQQDGVLVEYFEIFNDLFFFGALKFCTVRFEYDDGNLGSCAGPEHDLEERASIPNNFICLIRIDPAHTGLIGTESILKHYLETLLHEMLHAWFQIYACGCDDCSEAKLTTLGGSGHADGWQLASLAIEKATQPLLGVEFKVGRYEGLLSEYPTNYDKLGHERLVQLGHQEPYRRGSTEIWNPGYHLRR